MSPTSAIKRIQQAFAILWLSIYLPAAGATPVQAAGWLLPPAAQILFQDDFEDGTLDGWEMTGPGTWFIEDGKLVVDMGEGFNLNGYAYAGDSGWRDFSLDLDVQGVDGTDKALGFRVDEAGGYWLNIRGAPFNDILLGKNAAWLGTTEFPNTAGVWYHVRVEVSGSHIKVYVDDQLKFALTDPAAVITHGKISLIGWTGDIGADTVRFDNVVVRLLNPVLVFLPGILKP